MKLSVMEMRDLVVISDASAWVASDTDQELSRIKGQVCGGLDVDRSDDRLALADLLLGLPDDLCLPKIPSGLKSLMLVRSRC
ncbi:MAG TPA: hypothetical protein VG204_19840 [Terriglobia bacterium]|nr:hypothetical protein [Terriglobia bacterium]